MRKIKVGRYEVDSESVQVLINADGTLHAVYVFMSEEELAQVARVVTANITPEPGVRLICWHPNRAVFHTPL